MIDIYRTLMQRDFTRTLAIWSQNILGVEGRQEQKREKLEMHSFAFPYAWLGQLDFLVMKEMLIEIKMPKSLL